MSSPINPTNANPQAPLPAKKKGGCVKWGAGLFGGFIALSIIAGMIGDDTPTSSSPITSATASTAKSAELPASTTAAAHELASTNEESAPVVQDVPKEYKSALKKAEIYSEKMHMSKAGLFEQLTSLNTGRSSPSKQPNTLSITSLPIGMPTRWPRRGSTKTPWQCLLKGSTIS